ncbi:hypothetical protein S83_021141 [Arachis hypogaea]|nr:uncharacterized protein DS421_16g564170 [Arachis hypogaea]
MEAGINMFVMPPVDEKDEAEEEPIPYKVFSNTTVETVPYMILQLRGILEELMRPMLKDGQDNLLVIPEDGHPLYHHANSGHRLYFYFPNDPPGHEGEGDHH